MSEVRDLGQRGIAAVWDDAGSLGADSAAEQRLADLIADVAEVEAQLAGARLHLLNEARLLSAECVLEGVRQSVRTTSTPPGGHGNIRDTGFNNSHQRPGDHHAHRGSRTRTRRTRSPSRWPTAGRISSHSSSPAPPGTRQTEPCRPETAS